MGVENMGEITPAEIGQSIAEPKLPSLPAKGRRLSFRAKVALGIAGLATAATGAVGYAVSTGGGPGKTESPARTSIVEPSNSAIPKPIDTEKPIVEVPSSPQLRRALPSRLKL